MSGPTVRSGATLDLTVRASRPVVDAQVVPGPAGPPGASAFGIIASGTATASFANAATATVNITFPAGRFSSAPQVTATPRSGATPYIVNASNVTESGATLTVARHDLLVVSGTAVTIDWFAVQTTGPGQPPAGYPVLATNIMPRPQPTATFPWTVYGTTGNPQVIWMDGDPEVGQFARFTVSGITAGNGLQFAPTGIVVGTTYMASSFLRNNGPEPLTVQLSATQASPNAGPILVVPNDGVWRRYSFAFAATGTGTSFRMVSFILAGSLSGTIDVARASVTPGPALLDYFDGNTPGGRWTGAVGNSVSELLGPRMGDIQGIVAARTPLELVGEGMPNGAVSAPVGTYYTDTAATNGAIRWIKQTGTGNTGWRVLWGDTGTRTLTGLLINGWTATNISIRRWGDLVTLWVNVLNPAAATDDIFMPDLGLGWRQLLNARQAVPAVSGGNPAQVGRLFPGSGTLGFGMPRAGLLPFTFNGCWSWQSAEAWPATLPGT